MQHNDRVLLGPTSLDIDALLTIDSGNGNLTASEARELRAKGWLDPNCDVPLITIEGRVLLERVMKVGRLAAP